jgi:hypothetical protein
MKGVEPVEDKPEAAAAPTQRKVALPRYTEFVLRTEPEKVR